jgi:hypothetical protein
MQPAPAGVPRVILRPEQGASTLETLEIDAEQVAVAPTGEWRTPSMLLSYCNAARPAFVPLYMYLVDNIENDSRIKNIVKEFQSASSVSVLRVPTKTYK